MPEMQAEKGSFSFFIKTFGCQMNVADTERMGALLSESGMHQAREIEEADLILVNGCSVRDKAVHKALSTLGQFRELKKTAESQGRKQIIGIGGCVGQLEKKALFSSAPHLDFVFGTDAIDQLPEIVHRVRGGERKVIFTDFDRTQNYSVETKMFGKKAQAFVNIMKGCDKYCTYCIVPFTRGKEKSRKIQEVLDDVARLVKNGVREVTLLGQNVNSFGKGNEDLLRREPRELTSPIGRVGPALGEENFPQLLHAMEKDERLAALRRVRFTSSHPLDFSDELLDCYRTISRLASHLHLPVQSGSDAVLQRMGRHHKIETYLRQMERLRDFVPEIGLSTDIIVGFPGETDEDFQATLRMLDRLQLDNVYAFAYSSRPGTRAEKLADDVSKSEKNRRLNVLLKHQLAISERRYAAKLDRTMEILVEGPARHDYLLRDRAGVGTVYMGRTTCNRVVNLVSESPRDLTGQFVLVKIVDTANLSLQGEVVH